MKMNETEKIEKVNMTINIGGEHIPLSVAFSKQNAVRDAEKAVADRYNIWRAKWPSRSDKEILAMVAYQFAYFYQELQSDFNRINDFARETDNLLGKIIESSKD